MSETFSKRVFIASILFLLSLVFFTYGLLVCKFEVWPYENLSAIYSASKTLFKFGVVAPEQLLIEVPADAPRKRFTVHRPDLGAGGFYVFMGGNEHGQGYSALLYNAEGELLHTWSWDYASLDPDGPLNGSDMPHGLSVLHDGSLIVNFDDGDVMSRLDACGKPVWVKSGVYHHSLTQDEDGSYWVWRGEGHAASHYQFLENFDPDSGEIIRELALVGDVINKTAFPSILFGIRPDYKFSRFEKQPAPSELEKTDIFHPNDIDVLHSSLAGMFPGFKAGDLLLSFRNMHLIVVLDPDDKQIKWWNHGPWRFQHDPDFTDDGKISVYNNNRWRDHSEILKIDPVTREVSNDLLTGDVNFYSGQMGKHQYLPNGNILITVPEEGRVIEVTNKGMKVLEFNNVSRINASHNVHVENGIWLPENYFEQLPRCSD